MELPSSGACPFVVSLYGTTLKWGMSVCGRVISVVIVANVANERNMQLCTLAIQRYDNNTYATTTNGYAPLEDRSI